MCETCHEDYELPVSAKKCPICAADIVRLFDAVNVATGLSISKAVDKMAQPYADAKDHIANAREQTAKNDRELKDRIEHAMPQVNQSLQQGGVRPISAGQAIGMIDGAGRMASQINSSLLFGRKVQHVKLKD
jgi:soluble cytochrome b562